METEEIYIVDVDMLLPAAALAAGELHPRAGPAAAQPGAHAPRHHLPRHQHPSRGQPLAAFLCLRLSTFCTHRIVANVI